MVKYLAKFVSKQEHADMLLNGVLFMRPALYYHSLELGQGDLREAAVFDKARIYKNSHFPIYCMYAIDDSVITDGAALISERVVQEFNCENGYIVLIDYARFKPMLSTIQTHGYQLDAGCVSYHRLPFAESKRLFCENSLENLFIKHPFFSHQKEYRIAIANSACDAEGVALDHVEYHFPSNLKSVAHIIRVNSLHRKDGNYILDGLLDGI